MVDFVYDKKNNTLTGHNNTWKVRSGIPGKYSPTPTGMYTIPVGALMAGVSGYGAPHNNKYAAAPYSYRDDRGFSWFLWMGVDNLGIHPDGNVPGTKGCIGIIDDDTMSLFNIFKQLNISEIIRQVK